MGSNNKTETRRRHIEHTDELPHELDDLAQGHGGRGHVEAGLLLLLTLHPGRLFVIALVIHLVLARTHRNAKM